MSGKEPSLIEQHESWISLDPVLGCPASCAYCYLAPLGLFRKIPVVRENTPEYIYQVLQEYKLFEKSRFADVPSARRFPICIGNYTDMCLTQKNRDFLLSLLEEHKCRMPEVPICIVTKAALSRTFLETLNQLQLKIIFFISISFLPREFEKGTQPTKSRLRNFELISEFANLSAIHFWRPITSISIPDQEAIKSQIQLLQGAGSKTSVITGLKFGDHLADIFKSDVHHPFHKYFERHVGKTCLKHEIFEEDIQEAILKTAKELCYPVYLHTSCAVSYVLKRPEYNATFRKPYLDSKCLSCPCPTSQRELCFSFRRNFRFPSETLLNQVATFLNLPSSSIRYSEDQDVIIIKGVLSQEEQSFLTQATSFTVRGEALIPTLEWVGSINR